MGEIMRFGLIATAIALAAPLAAATPPQKSGNTKLQDRMAIAPDLFIARSHEDAALKTGIMKDLYRIGGGGQWAVDLDLGIITFTDDERIVTAPVQVIGTYNQKDGTWLWGWDHPSVPPATAVAAKALRDYGARYKLSQITTRKIACSEDEAWEFASMASYLTDAQGLYRGPSGTTLVYMVFGTVTLAKA